MEENQTIRPDRKPLSVAAGALCVILGALWLADSVFGFGIFTMDRLWPLFVLVPGLTFEYYHYRVARVPGFLVPGGILTVIGLLFFFETFTYWRFSQYTWPVYILAVTAGLAQLSAAVGNPPGLLGVVAALGLVFAISAISVLSSALFRVIPFKIILPLTLIAAGAWIIVAGSKKPKR